MYCYHRPRCARGPISILILPMLVVALIGLMAPAPLRAVELPPTSSPIFIQTNGPTANIGLGDWYTSDQNGFGGGYHYLGIEIPCGWPSNLDVNIDLYSPEINTFGPLPYIDEITGTTLSDTIFELYNRGTPVVGPNKPGPGDAGSLFQRRFTPVTSQPEQWERFYTLPAPVACGSYVLRAETTGDDQNSWRLRIGHDNDNNPNNALPVNYENPDGKDGSGDELAISIGQTTYQHDQVGQVECMVSYQYVRPNVPSVSFHNFDLDNNERVTYYPPSATFDPQGAPTPGSIAGTLSGNAVWNGGTQTSRGTGDVVQNPEPGWWRLVTCVKDDNQFNQEGQTGVPTFRQPVPEPNMVITKDDGQTFIAAGDVLTYTIRFTNQSPSTKQIPGAAFNVRITDTLPLDLSFRGCGFVTPGLTGTCAPSGQDVIFALDGSVSAGASGEVRVVAQVNPGASGQQLNRVALDYTDQLNNPNPTVFGEDLDIIPATVPPPAIDVTKSARLIRDSNGNGLADPADRIAYTLAVTNTGAVAVTGVTLRDTPDVNTTLLTGSVSFTRGGGLIVRGNGPSDSDVLAQIGTIVPGDAAWITFAVQVKDQLPAGTAAISNQAIVRGDNVPDTPSDDPSTPDTDDPTDVPTGSSGGGPPTAITLTDFRALASGDGVAIIWTTGLEINTASFTIMRAPSPDPSAAAPLSGQIAARGSGGGGASYRYIDTTIGAGQAGYYWLVEHEIGGDTHSYGPVAYRPALQGGAGPYQVYLPLVLR